MSTGNLSLIEDRFRPLFGALGLAPPSSRRDGALGLAPPSSGGAIHRVQVEDRRGERTIAIVPREAFAGALTLAVDRAVARLTPRPPI